MSRKNIHRNERIFHFLILKNIINGRNVLGSAEKCKENRKDECKNILCEIFYVLSVHISGKILDDQKVGRYGTDGNQGHLFFVCLVGIIIPGR